MFEGISGKKVFEIMQEKNFNHIHSGKQTGSLTENQHF